MSYKMPDESLTRTFCFGFLQVPVPHFKQHPRAQHTYIWVSVTEAPWHASHQGGGRSFLSRDLWLKWRDIGLCHGKSSAVFSSLRRRQRALKHPAGKAEKLTCRTRGDGEKRERGKSWKTERSAGVGSSGTDQKYTEEAAFFKVLSCSFFCVCDTVYDIKLRIVKDKGACVSDWFNFNFRLFHLCIRSHWNLSMSIWCL